MILSITNYYLECYAFNLFEILIGELSLLTFHYVILAGHLLILWWKVIYTAIDNTIICVFTDSSAILCDEQLKKPCRKFLQKGNLKQFNHTFIQWPGNYIKCTFCYCNNNYFPCPFSGICDFGPNCRFSHMSEEDMFHLQRQVEGKL